MSERSTTAATVTATDSSPSKHKPNPKSPIKNAQSSLMARKSSFLKQTLIASTIFLLVIYVFFGPSSAPPLTDDQLPVRSFDGFTEKFAAKNDDFNRNKVKVYMYDLPKKFTTGIIEQHARARGSSDVSKATYPGHQHMGEWYVFSDMNRPESERVGSPVIKVDDPDEADLFYVPVFSSLSLIVNPVNRPPGSSQVYSDEAMQDSLVAWLEKQEYWRRNNGRDHVIFAGDPNALYRVIDRVKKAVLLLSDFGRVREDQGSLVKDVIVPYAHRINSFNGDFGVEKRETLLFFMGNRYRKDGGRIRDLLFQMLESEEDVVIKHGTQSRENRRAATRGMHTSKFCLNPAGDTPSACRLFDSIVSLCVPVIVSDSIELPFEDIIDYSRIAIFVETSDSLKPGYLVNLLRSVSAEKIMEYQRALKEVNNYFEYGILNGTVNEIWRQVAQKLPLIELMINRDKRLVRKDKSLRDCACLCTNNTGVMTKY